MRRRPPVTILAYSAVIIAILVWALIVDGTHPVVLFAVVILGGSAVGLYFGIRVVWILVIAFYIVNIVGVVATGSAGSVVPLGMVLALLIAPPSRRYFRRDPAAPATVSRAGRAIRLTATVLAGLVLGLAAHAILFAPDPVGGDLELVRSNRPGLRVLFVGNSLTADNAMIRTVRRLGEGDPRAPAIFAARYTRRGLTLQDALEDDRLRELLGDERWNYIVLQEHSLRASRPAERRARTLPAAVALDALARHTGAQTVLFVHPGYERGDEDASGDTQAAMRARLRQGSNELAVSLSAVLAPVGDAWDATLRRQPQIDLWVGDGIRPTKTGSYVTACVLYAVLTRRDPTASRFAAGLDPVQARWLRSVAAASVATRDDRSLRRAATAARPRAPSLSGPSASSGP